MTQEEMDKLFSEAHEAMDHALQHLSDELAKIRTGKASPAMVSGLLVPYYGSPTPLAQVANVTTADSRTISIQPWEKNMIGPIEKAIFEANLGLTPMNNGEVVLLTIPPLTEERRKDLVKQARHLAEEAKISVRSTRHKVMDGIKKAVKDGYPEDLGKKREIEIQNMTNTYGEKADHLVDVKEKDILTV
ncbi:MAG: ribosome recycling factor [Saprospiraceae bacterium]|nr:ribosome recycling factor [Saprospiraceae bacterium]